VTRPIEIRTAPHLKRPQGVEQIMRNVVYALVPVAMFSVWQFGISALALIVTTTLVAMLTEQLFSQLAGRGNTLGDWSVVITGMLLALTLPPGFPLWMAAVAAFVGVALGKALFGGLGFNVMNPALVGRAFVQAAFPVAITTWTPAFAPGRFSEFIPSTLATPFMKPDPVTPWINGLDIDGFTGATPLAMQKFQQISASTNDLLFGNVIGSTGEASAILILLGGLYLAFRRMLDWRIPVGVFAGAALVAVSFAGVVLETDAYLVITQPLEHTVPTFGYRPADPFNYIFQCLLPVLVSIGPMNSKCQLEKPG